MQPLALVELYEVLVGPRVNNSCVAEIQSLETNPNNSNKELSLREKSHRSAPSLQGCFCSTLISVAQDGKCSLSSTQPFSSTKASLAGQRGCVPQGADFLLQANSAMANWVFGSCGFRQPNQQRNSIRFSNRELLWGSGLLSQFAIGGRQPTAGWAGDGTVSSDRLTLLLCCILICTHSVEDGYPCTLSWLFHSFCTHTSHTSLYCQSIRLGEGLQQVLLHAAILCKVL